MQQKEIPEDERPLSELYRIAARDWVDLDSAANLLEECKSAVFSERLKALGNMPVSRAEHEVKASPEWREYLEEMVKARSKANLAKVKLKWIEMRFYAWQSSEANQRHEARLSR